MIKIKLCPQCGLDYDTCETCGKKGCFDCEGWTRTSDDCMLCPECAAASKEEYNKNTDNGTKVCGSCALFKDECDDGYGYCEFHQESRHCSQYCEDRIPKQVHDKPELLKTE